MAICKTCKCEWEGGVRVVKGEQRILLNCGPCRAKVTEKVSKFNKTDKGKRNMARSNASDAGKERQKRFNGTTKGREKIKRGRQSEKGIARKRNELREKRENPAKRLAASLREALNRIWHQDMQNAPILWKHTEFESATDVLDHLKQFVPDDMELDEARKTLEIEHTIAVKYYDHSVPENARRCHSKANLTLMTKESNEEKATKIDAEMCHAMGVQWWPVEWEGVLP